MLVGVVARRNALGFLTYKHSCCSTFLQSHPVCSYDQLLQTPVKFLGLLRRPASSIAREKKKDLSKAKEISPVRDDHIDNHVQAGKEHVGHFQTPHVKESKDVSGDIRSANNVDESGAAGLEGSSENASDLENPFHSHHANSAINAEPMHTNGVMTLNGAGHTQAIEDVTSASSSSQQPSKSKSPQASLGKISFYVKSFVRNPIFRDETALRNSVKKATETDIDVWVQTLQDYVWIYGAFLKGFPRLTGLTKDKMRFWRRKKSLILAERNLELTRSMTQHTTERKVDSGMSRFEMPWEKDNLVSIVDSEAAFRDFDNRIIAWRAEIVRSLKLTTLNEVKSDLSSMKARIFRTRTLLYFYSKFLLSISQEQWAKIQEMKMTGPDKDEEADDQRPVSIARQHEIRKSEAQEKFISDHSSPQNPSDGDGQSLRMLREKFSENDAQLVIVLKKKKSLLASVGLSIHENLGPMVERAIRLKQPQRYRQYFRKINEIANQERLLLREKHSLHKAISWRNMSDSEETSSSEQDNSMLLPITLPCNVEYYLATTIVNAFKRSFFRYGNRQFPQAMKDEHWDYPEAVDIIKLYRVAEQTSDLGILSKADQERVMSLLGPYYEEFAALRAIRNITAHPKRTPILFLTFHIHSLEQLAHNLLQDEAVVEDLISYRNALRLFEALLIPKNVQLHERLERELREITKSEVDSEEKSVPDREQNIQNAVDKYREEYLKYSEMYCVGLVKTIKKSTPPPMEWRYAERKSKKDPSSDSTSIREPEASKLSTQAEALSLPLYRQSKLRLLHLTNLLHQEINGPGPGTMLSPNQVQDNLPIHAAQPICKKRSHLPLEAAPVQESATVANSDPGVNLSPILEPNSGGDVSALTQIQGGLPTRELGRHRLRLTRQSLNAQNNPSATSSSPKITNLAALVKRTMAQRANVAYTPSGLEDAKTASTTSALERKTEWVWDQTHVNTLEDCDGVDTSSAHPQGKSSK